MADYTKKPRLINSKENCLCAETHDVIDRGERVLFLPETKKVYCNNSERFQEYIAKFKNKGNKNKT